MTPVPGVDTVQPAGAGIASPIYAPEVCGDLRWTTATGARRADVDISVVPRASGAQVLAVPLSGGSVTAYALDKEMNMQSIGASLAIDDAFTRVSASDVRGHLIATALDASSLKVDMLADDLGKAAELAKLEPGAIAKPAFQRADGIDFMPVADAQGLRLEFFDDAWRAKPLRVATTEGATGLTAARMETATVAVWATKASCYMMTVFTAQAGPMDKLPVACNSPRIAIDSATHAGQVVYEDASGIHALSTHHVRFDKSQVIAPDGIAPRVLWDGARFWISYLDASGDIVVGYLDDNARFRSTTIVGPKPGARSYELEIISGQVWAVALDSDGYSATRVCLSPS